MRIAHATRDAVPAPVVLAAGWASVGLGIAGLVLVAVDPAPVVAVLAGTAGIAAATAGGAVLTARPPGRRSRTAVPAVGTATGALAALLLVAQLGATLVTSSGAAPVHRVAVPAVAIPTRAALAGAVNALAYLLATARPDDGGWPAGLAVTGDRRLYATSGPNVGHLLLQAPARATLSY